MSSSTISKSTFQSPITQQNKRHISEIQSKSSITSTPFISQKRAKDDIDIDFVTPRKYSNNIISQNDIDDRIIHEKIQQLEKSISSTREIFDGIKKDMDSYVKSLSIETSK
jgi:hypothetical protein